MKSLNCSEKVVLLNGKIIQRKFFIMKCHLSPMEGNTLLCDDFEFKMIFSLKKIPVFQPNMPPSMAPIQPIIQLNIESCNQMAIIFSSIDLLDDYTRCRSIFKQVHVIEESKPNYECQVACIHASEANINLTIYCLMENKVCNFHCDDMSKDYEALMNNKDSSDLTVVVGDEKFSCHKLILSARSSVFARMFQSDILEKQKCQVTINDITPETFGLLKKFIYTGRLDEVEINERKVDGVELMLAAEKYHVDGLKKVCGQKLADSLTFDNAIDALILADHINEPGLKDFTADYIVRHKSIFLNTEKYEALIKNHAELAILLLRKLMESK